ncbi:P27 family phage terminase small subunit [Listeria booriae]|uniref:P27 family phage terminase small subunit n=1 Tax=Listeria booriae TaxID=1552123 RepID=A0A841XN21_9LIST|nr:P27 family phage terminase small subunit [Listeria booriae]MBC1316602.1 P27 family phage terminase small subunit [Listeria booriae]
MSMAKIKKQLLSSVNSNDEVEKEKVDRYINLLNIFYELDKSIKTNGVMVETINASQRFLKPNPAIAEKNKINASLIALGRDINCNLPPPDKKKGDSYIASDLT